VIHLSGGFDKPDKETAHDDAVAETILTNFVFTVKLVYNENPRYRLILFVIAVIRYNRENRMYKCGHLGPEMSALILLYNREFVIAVIVN